MGLAAFMRVKLAFSLNIKNNKKGNSFGNKLICIDLVLVKEQETRLFLVALVMGKILQEKFV